VSLAEMVFGATICLPNQLRSLEERPVEDFVKQLSDMVPPPTRLPSALAVAMPAHLSQHSMYCIRVPLIANPVIADSGKVCGLADLFSSHSSQQISD
jgi:hypothetical protein